VKTRPGRADARAETGTGRSAACVHPRSAHFPTQKLLSGANYLMHKAQVRLAQTRWARSWAQSPNLAY